jgi:hypothetical protein
MRRLVEWFFSLFISKSKIDIVRKEASCDLKKEYTKYQNEVYFNKLRKSATKKRL